MGIENIYLVEGDYNSSDLLSIIMDVFGLELVDLLELLEHTTGQIDLQNLKTADKLDYFIQNIHSITRDDLENIIEVSK